MKQRSQIVHGTLIILWRRLASISLWYCALALGLILVLVATAAYQPSIASNMVFDRPELSWLTVNEAAHMQDVHNLVRDFLLIGISASIIVGSYWYHNGLDRGMTRGALAMMVALCALLIPFPWTFRFFHAAFFPQGNWQFPTDSWLITTFPLWYFAVAAVVWFGSSVLMLWIVHRRVSDKTKKEENRNRKIA